jgi:hypothetical protein
MLSTKAQTEKGNSIGKAAFRVRRFCVWHHN